MNITVCDVCGRRITTFEPMVTGLKFIIEEYQCGAKTRTFDICPECRERLTTMFDTEREARHYLGFLG